MRPRHSPGSSVIRVSAVRDGVHVAVSVADEGRGIPAERLPHLFRKFSGMESQEQREDTGLALAICKGIVEAHGGRILAESDGPGPGRPLHLHPAHGRRRRNRREGPEAHVPRRARRGADRQRRENWCGCWPWTTTPSIFATSRTPSPGRVMLPP